MSILRQNQKGFTLFEVVIATAIMSSAALLLSSAWGGNRVRIRKIEINNRAAFLLDRAVAEIEVEYANRFLQIPEEDSGVFENYPDFTWSMKSQKFEMPDLRSLLVSDGDGDEFMLLIIEKMSEYFNESIKEVKVTLTYTKGKKSVKYSATTFMVDYNRPIPLPGGGGGGGLPGGVPGG